MTRPDKSGRAGEGGDDGLDPARWRMAHTELRGCMIRRSGPSCEVRKEFLEVALNALGSLIDPHPAGPFEIEKGVPMPPSSVGHIGGCVPKYPWRKMEIGDSFFAAVPESVIRGSRHNAQKYTGFKFTSRNVPGGVRVWRVEKPPRDCDEEPQP